MPSLEESGQQTALGGEMRPSYQCLFFTRDYAVMLSHELVKKKQELSSTSKSCAIH